VQLLGDVEVRGFLLHRITRTNGREDKQQQSGTSKTKEDPNQHKKQRKTKRNEKKHRTR
jgi:hypothetical protein